MSVTDTKALSRAHVRQTVSRNGFVAGVAVYCEFNRETALDNFCAAVENVGGEVVAIDEREVCDSVERAPKTARHYYTVVAIVPKHVLT